MLDDVYAVHVFSKGNEDIGMKERPRDDADTLCATFQEIQNLQIRRNQNPTEKRLVITFDTECFHVFIETDIINASELFDVAQFVQKDDVKRLEEKVTH